jgi:hypothetical protein
LNNKKNLALSLGIFGILARNPKRLALTHEVLVEEAEKNYVIKRYGLKHGLPTIDMLDLFQSFEETVEPYSFLADTSETVDIALLKALARRYDGCDYLEIGSWRGESIANVASIADKCISISFSEEEMLQHGFSEKFHQNNRFFSKDLKNVTHIGHDSLTFDFSPFIGRMDLVFVDGDHSHEGVKLDTQNAFKLTRNHFSTIVWHDYSFNTETVRWTILAGILDGCPEEKRGNLFHVSNTNCAIYTEEKFETSFATYPQNPDKKFTVTISTSKL